MHQRFKIYLAYIFLLVNFSFKLKLYSILHKFRTILMTTALKLYLKSRQLYWMQNIIIYERAEEGKKTQISRKDGQTRKC